MRIIGAAVRLRSLSLMLVAGLLTACVQPKPNLQLAEGKDQACVRGCRGDYSLCVSGASGQMNRLIAGDVIVGCNTGFEACLAACPPISKESAQWHDLADRPNHPRSNQRRRRVPWRTSRRAGG